MCLLLLLFVLAAVAVACCFFFSLWCFRSVAVPGAGAVCCLVGGAHTSSALSLAGTCSSFGSSV